MYTATCTIVRDDEDIELDVNYDVAPYSPAQTYGPPEDCSPAEGGEIEELTAYLDGNVFALTPDEKREVEAQIYEHHEYN